MSKDNSTSTGGIGFFGLLGIVFIVLKLLGKIDWPWVWVLAPIWIQTAFVMVLIFTGIVIMLLRDK